MNKWCQNDCSFIEQLVLLNNLLFFEIQLYIIKIIYEGSIMNVELAKTVLAPAEMVYQWHTRDGAFDRLMPPWEDVKVLSSSGEFDDLRVDLQVKKMGVPVYWTAQHYDVKCGVEFNDRQITGPFKSWQHRHQFVAISKDRTKLVDTVKFSLPVHLLTGPFVGWRIKNDIKKMIRYRHQLLSYDCSLLNRMPLKPQVIAISGSSGMIGRSLISFLTAAGHTVRRMVRGKKLRDTDLSWDPMSGIQDDFSDVTMMVHLAGETINSTVRWTKQKRQRIYDSRVLVTQTLVNQLNSTSHNVSTLVVASGTSFYGSSDDKCDESSPAGDSFLATVANDWESSCDLIRDKVRVCHARFGMVLHPSGGVIQRLAPLMSLGALGPIGSGHQFVSWVALDDAIRAIYMMLANDDVVGPVNVVSPRPQTQGQWMADWAKAVGRPAIVPLPSLAVKTVFGQMGSELLLASSRVIPGVLTKKDAQFQCQTMKDWVGFYSGKL